MKETARNTRQFVERWAARHPDDSDLPLMRQFAGIGDTLVTLKGQALQVPTTATPSVKEASARATAAKADTQEDQKETPQDRRTILHGRYEGAMSSSEFYTPKFQTAFWRDMFADDPSIVIPECNWTAGQMQRPMMDVRDNEVKPMLVLVPNGFASKDGLVRAGLRYPWLRHTTVGEGTPIIDRHASVGYVKVEATHDAPNLDTTEEDIVNYLKREDRQSYRGQREITNIHFGEALYILTGEYPDLRTISRLPGSVSDAWVVGADRDSGGGLDADWVLNPRGHGGGLGFRLEEVQST